MRELSAAPPANAQVEEAPPQRRVIYLDEHLTPDQLAELHKPMSDWMHENPQPSSSPNDLLCLIGPWGCAQLPLFCLSEDMPLLDPSSPGWTAEDEIQYLLELLNQADEVPSPPPNPDDFSHLQRLTGTAFIPSESDEMQDEESTPKDE